jgi:hypothetical protein
MSTSRRVLFVPCKTSRFVNLYVTLCTHVNGTSLCDGNAAGFYSVGISAGLPSILTDISRSTPQSVRVIPSDRPRPHFFFRSLSTIHDHFFHLIRRSVTTAFVTALLSKLRATCTRVSC